MFIFILTTFYLWISHVLSPCYAHEIFRTTKLRYLRDVVCRVSFIDVHYSQERSTNFISESDHEWHCVQENSEGGLNAIVYVLDGLSENFVSTHRNELIGGNAVIEIERVDETVSWSGGYRMTVNSESRVKLRRRQLRKKREKEFPGLFDVDVGTKIRSVLVVRVAGIDTTVTSSLTELSDSVFGTFGHKPSMKSQYDACSFGKLTFEKAVGKGILHGVARITVPRVLTGVDTGYAINEVQKLVNGKIDLSKDTFDHIIFCMPPGVLKQQREWIAYAELGGQRSVLNDEWCTSLSTLMHEIGHNLGLYHSGMGEGSYADITGYMGTSVLSKTGPLMCFNGAHGWQLGFYSDRHKTITRSSLPWEEKLFGVSQYNLTKTREVVIARVVLNGEIGDFFISFNLASGINSGTRASQNNVTIIQSDNRETNLTASLSASEVTSMVMDGGEGQLIINVTDIYVGNSDTDALSYAAIKIFISEPENRLNN